MSLRGPIGSGVPAGSLLHVADRWTSARDLQVDAPELPLAQDSLVEGGEVVKEPAEPVYVPLARLWRWRGEPGGHAHSQPLRTWALRELQGYEGTHVAIPDYRKISAPLMMDGIAGMHQFRKQPVSRFDLPDFARDDLSTELRFGQGVGQIESLLARDPSEAVLLAPTMAAELAAVMSRDPARQVLRLYWAVHPSALEGVLDQVRTRLVELVGELRATMTQGSRTPHRTRWPKPSRTSALSPATTPQ